MNNTIIQIIEQQRIISDILGYYDPPLCREGISPHVLRELEIKMERYGFIIPKSYKDFLKIHDGIENFSCSFSLFGSNEFCKDSYIDELSDIVSSGIGYEFDQNIPPLMIGSSKETNTKVFFDFSHERRIDEEPIVLEGDPGFLTLHYSFYDFLECRIKANKKTIQTLSNYIEKNIKYQ